MTDTPRFETDNEGNIISNPVTGWLSASFAGMTAILAIYYAPTPEALESGQSSSIQFALTPRQCQELGERLTTLARSLRGQSPPGTPVN
jgi:hypothetical protein